MADRRSDLLKGTDSLLRKTAPAAWLLSIVLLILGKLAAGVESTLLEVAKVAAIASKDARNRDQTSEFLVWLARVVKELSPFMKAAGLFVGFTAVVLSAGEAALREIQKRASLWTEDTATTTNDDDKKDVTDGGK